MAADDAVMSYARQAKKEAQRLRKEAFRTYADPERKAQALRRVYEYTYLMQHLANTPTGQDIARHCDKWKDYRR
jgi:acyl-CoA synthetase (NDP forming)